MQFVVVDTNKGFWAQPEVIDAPSFEKALDWCNKNDYDLIETL